MSFSKDCEELFGHTDLYKIFGVEKTDPVDKIKKAYRKLALVWHPDRFNENTEHYFMIEREAEECSFSGDYKDLAKRKFQVIGRAYQVLSDDEKRKQYDETGMMDDGGSGDVDWTQYFRRMFPKVTKDQINEHLKSYFGSDEEIEDIIAAYLKCEGNIDMMYEYIIGMDFSTEFRIKDIIYHLIAAQEVPEFDDFINDTPAAREKRRKKYEKETAEFERMMEKKKTGKGKPKSEDDLIAAIRNNCKKRESAMDAMINKYSSSKKAKK
ncbi:unnamed protein product [Bursaphelenchus okinawaensis]|uniref:J domain-containing protein n=1 Tax=Bursaphelenchus okinawaensis TaxID=465554 RepID=A0A811K5Q1_9BILA|nr:unnamed protein product [Bursaphelenchus okinawaensis]CAG9091885.1 unnamed protein product [Bursaphelenchus okinawaensis]